jgi:hypothetical protein
VTDWYLLLEQLRQHPEEDSLAFMLHDALVESGDYTDLSAAQLVEAERQEARDQLRLAEAAKLMRTDTTSAGYLYAVIHRKVRIPRWRSTQIILVVGEGAPTRWGTGTLRGSVAGDRETITVGAGWVLTLWTARLAEHERRRHRDDPRPRRR